MLSVLACLFCKYSLFHGACVHATSTGENLFGAYGAPIEAL